MNTHIIQTNDFIINLYSILDDLKKIIEEMTLKEGSNVGGAPSKLSDGEAIAIACLRWKSGATSWKSFYYETLPRYYSYFQKLPSYKNFVQHMHRIASLALQLMTLLEFIVLGKSTGTFFVDSCPIEVCHVKRANSNKVASGIASKKKSSMGWFYGLKLHVVCNENREIVSLQITTGSVDDRAPLEALVKHLKGLIVADAGYVGEELREKLRQMGIDLMAAPRNNMKKLMTKAQHLLFKKRQKIEQVFSIIKYRFGLNCSLARSVNGIFTILMTAVFWYQINLVILS